MVDEVSCAELFDRLLALDHERREPWGPLHGEAVACYFAQHPNAPRAPRDTGPLLDRLRRFVGDGVEAGDVLPGATIHAVAVDGSFPAAGYRDRLERWARSIVAADAGGGQATPR
ncbi:hypothetical protein GH723_16720 [Actinomarinicola tropica]|uniref:Uncharacterized protein n=1 Tax=Actinomarinicola tropica TaxID=2789776 RepID=A0A5Q2RRR7_9ACTN|nr:hypothetical protein GH723_16720 [Actinomarinicola tropica]